jgi:hypothetical protein
MDVSQAHVLCSVRLEAVTAVIMKIRPTVFRDVTYCVCANMRQCSETLFKAQDSKWFSFIPKMLAILTKIFVRIFQFTSKNGAIIIPLSCARSYRLLCLPQEHKLNTRQWLLVTVIRAKELEGLNVVFKSENHCFEKVWTFFFIWTCKTVVFVMAAVLVPCNFLKTEHLSVQHRAVM